MTGQLRNSAFEVMPVEEFQAVLETHLAGSFYVTQPAYRVMKAAGCRARDRDRGMSRHGLDEGLTITHRAH